MCINTVETCSYTQTMSDLSRLIFGECSNLNRLTINKSVIHDTSDIKYCLHALYREDDGTDPTVNVFQVIYQKYTPDPIHGVSFQKYVWSYVYLNSTELSYVSRPSSRHILTPLAYRPLLDIVPRIQTIRELNLFRQQVYNIIYTRFPYGIDRMILDYYSSWIVEEY